MANLLTPNRASGTIMAWTNIAAGAKTKTHLDFDFGSPANGVTGPIDAALLTVSYMEGATDDNDFEVRVYESAVFAGNEPSSSYADDDIAYENVPTQTHIIATGEYDTTVDATCSTGNATLFVTTTSGINVGDRVAVETGSNPGDIDVYTVVGITAGVSLTLERNNDAAYTATTVVRKVSAIGIPINKKGLGTIRVEMENKSSAGTSRVMVDLNANLGYQQTT